MNGDFYSGIFHRNITTFVHICMYVCIFVGPFSCSEWEMSTSDILSVYVGLKTTTVTITSFECDYTRHHYNPALCLLFVTLGVCVCFEPLLLSRVQPFVYLNVLALFGLFVNFKTHTERIFTSRDYTTYPSLFHPTCTHTASCT